MRWFLRLWLPGVVIVCAIGMTLTVVLHGRNPEAVQLIWQSTWLVLGVCLWVQWRRAARAAARRRRPDISDPY